MTMEDMLEKKRFGESFEMALEVSNSKSLACNSRGWPSGSCLSHEACLVHFSFPVWFVSSYAGFTLCAPKGWWLGPGVPFS